MAQVAMEDVSKVYGEDVVGGWDMNFDIEGGESVMIVPLVALGVLNTAILTFTFAWNEFLFANTFLFDDATQPATVAVPNFATVYTVD